MTDEEVPEIEQDFAAESNQTPSCSFCKHMGTPRGNQLLFLVWVVIPILILIMVVTSQM